MAETRSYDKARREGRALACDGLLASAFGGRKTDAGAKAIRQLRRLESRERTNRNLWLAIAASLAILLSGAFYFLVRASGSYVAMLDGPAPGGTVIRNNRAIAAAAGMRLMAGDIFRTTKDAGARVRFHDLKSVVIVASQSELMFPPAASDRMLELHHGAIDVEFVGKAGQSVLTVATGQAEARVTGTHFVLAAKQTSTWLEVLEGSVQFARLDSGDTILVRARHYSVAAQGLELAAHPDDERWQTPYSIKPPALALAL
jgi:ferric-dicitrate binding protein FerR (iron transport regulator)